MMLRVNFIFYLSDLSFRTWKKIQRSKKKSKEISFILEGSVSASFLHEYSSIHLMLFLDYSSLSSRKFACSNVVKTPNKSTNIHKPRTQYTSESPPANLNTRPPPHQAALPPSVRESFMFLNW